MAFVASIPRCFVFSSCYHRRQLLRGLHQSASSTGTKMQKGKRKSPFIGSRETLGSGAAPILYFRYNSLADILLDGSAPAEQPAFGNGDGAPTEGARKKPKREKVKKPKPVEEANGTQQPKQPKQKKAPKLRKLEPEERVSGPGNAQEALKMREALGIVASTPQEIAEAQAAAQRAARPPSFGFGFGFNLGPAAASPPAATPAPAPVAAPGGGTSTEPSSDSESESEQEGPGQLAKAGGSSSSDSESDSGSESSDSEGKDQGKAAAAAGGSSDDGDESSDSDDESSSDSESDEEGASKAAARHAQQQQQQPWQPPQQRAAPAPAAPAAAAAAPAAAAADDEDEDGEFVPRRVYVGGMPFSYTEDKVHEYWSYCGEIEGMDMMTFPDTGRFRGIVFITFTTQEGYEAALGCDGEQCDGQTLKVQRCKWSPKERAARNRQRAAAAAGGAAGGAGAAQPQGHSPAPQQPAAYAEPAQRQPRQEGGGGFGGQDGGMGRRPQGAGGAAAAPKTDGYDVAYVGNIAFEADEKELLKLFEGYNVTKVRLHTDKDTGRSKGFAHVHFKDAESLDRALALNGTQLYGRRIKMGYAQPKKDQ